MIIYFSYANYIMQSVNLCSLHTLEITPQIINKALLIYYTKYHFGCMTSLMNKSVWIHSQTDF